MNHSGDIDFNLRSSHERSTLVASTKWIKCATFLHPHKPFKSLNQDLFNIEVGDLEVELRRLMGK